MRIQRICTIAILTAAVSLLAACATAAPDALVHIETHGKPVENGKLLDMRFDELERNPDDSLVQVTLTSGGSVSSSMFVMRGVCAVLIARDARYVMPKQLPGDNSRYRLMFYTRADEAPTLRVPRRDGKPDHVMSEAFSRSMCGFVRLLTSQD